MATSRRCWPAFLAREKSGLEPLQGFNRLKIGGMRIVLRQVSRDQFRLESANPRDLVYEWIQHLLEIRKQAGSP